MKRSALKRTSPLRRRTRLRPIGKTKYRRRTRDTDFMLYVLAQPCVLAGIDGAGKCWGRTQADHAGARGLGVKAPDNTCIPLCTKHHGNRTDYTGYFKGWQGAAMRQWCDRMIHLTQNLYDKFRELRQTPWRTA